LKIGSSLNPLKKFYSTYVIITIRFYSNIKGSNMAKKKSVHGMKLPVFTKGKLFRLLFFMVIILLAIILHRFFPSVRTFGWGFTFGMLCMAVLTG